MAVPSRDGSLWQRFLSAIDTSSVQKWTFAAVTRVGSSRLGLEPYRIKHYLNLWHGLCVNLDISGLGDKYASGREQSTKESI